MGIYNLEIDSHVSEVKEELASRIPVILEALAIEAEGNAVKEITKLGAIDTGRLKGSITHTTDGKEKAYIGTNVEYAKYVELGTGIYASNGQGRKTPWFYVDDKGQGHWTHGMKPRPFLSNAIQNYKDDYQRIVEEGLK